MPRLTNHSAQSYKPSRQPGVLSSSTRALTLSDLLILILAGCAAVAAVALFSTPIRIPGHVILKATLPLACGVALVRRPWAGTMSGLSTLTIAAVFLLTGTGNLQTAAVVSLAAMGPAIDWAMRGTGKRWQLIFRFVVAGLAVNLCAFAVRWGLALFEAESLHPLNMRQMAWGALVSFAVCGMAAGLISGLICWRNSAAIESES